MRILLLAPCPFFQNRGTPIAIRLAVEVLAGAGHRLQILTYPEGESVPIAGTVITRVASLPGIKNIKPGPSWKKAVYDLLMLVRAFSLMRKNRFDLVHAVEESAFLALALKKVFHVPFVYDMDSCLSQQLLEKYRWLRPFKSVLHFFERKVFRESSAVIAVCKALEDEVIECVPKKLICRLEDITLLPAQAGETPPSVPSAFSEPVIMYVGNLEKYQGIDLLLDGFQQGRPKLGEARLVIIGGAAEDIQRYQKRAKELGADEKIVFLGPKPISELPYWLAQSTILVSPRIQGENTPMKVYSYLDSGKPVLATRLPTHTQVLDDKIAYLVSPVAKDLAAGMVALMEDGLLRERLAQNAKERVQQEYCLEAFQRKLLHFYSRLESEMPHVADRG